MILDNNNKNCGIYCWTNINNGKVYIGQSVNLRKRKNYFLNFHLSYSGRRIDSARKRYNSPDDWKYEILEFCEPEELDKKEEEYIYLFNALNPELGYNLSFGGEGVRGVEMTESTKQKLREINLGKKLSKEHCQKISESLKGKFVGEKSSNYGKKMSDENKKKLIEAHQRKIKQLDKDTLEVIKIWDSIADFARSIGKENVDLSSVCEGKKNTAYGFKWCYFEDEQPPVFIEQKKDKIILQYDLNENFIKEWESIKKAAQFTEINDVSISGCCAGRQKTAGGFIWKYKNPEDMTKSIKSGRCKEILQYDLNGNFIKEWSNYREIFQEMNISTDAIKRSIYKSGTSHGYIWKFKDDKREVKPVVILPNHRKAVCQIDKETGEIINEFISATEAERVVGVSHSKICVCCKGKCKTAGGFKWRYKSDYIKDK